MCMMLGISTSVRQQGPLYTEPEDHGSLSKIQASLMLFHVPWRRTTSSLVGPSSSNTTSTSRQLQNEQDAI